MIDIANIANNMISLTRNVHDDLIDSSVVTYKILKSRTSFIRPKYKLIGTNYFVDVNGGEHWHVAKLESDVIEWLATTFDFEYDFRWCRIHEDMFIAMKPEAYTMMVLKWQS